MDGVVIDSAARVRPQLLSQALAAWRAHPQARRDRIAVADFAKASSAPRLYFVICKRAFNIERIIDRRIGF